MPILIPSHVDAKAKAQTLAKYDSLSSSAKSKLLAKLAYARGTIIADTACLRYTSKQQLPNFQNVVVNETLFLAGYCCSCAQASDAYKCCAATYLGRYERFEQLAVARSTQIIAAFYNGTFAIPSPYNTINGTLALLKSIMAKNPDDRLYELFELITIVNLLAIKEIDRLNKNAQQIASLSYTYSFCRINIFFRQSL